MRCTIWSYVKNWCTCQVNKQHKHKYGKLAVKLVTTITWEELCVDPIVQQPLKGKDGAEVDFMCLTMIDPASSWFEIVKLPVTTDMVIPMDTKGQKSTRTHNNTKLP